MLTIFVKITVMFVNLGPTFEYIVFYLFILLNVLNIYIYIYLKILDKLVASIVLFIHIKNVLNTILV